MRTIESIAKGAVPITPSDTTIIRPTLGIYVGVAGDVKVDMQDGSTVTFTGLAAGMFHGISVKRVYATGTTATGILAVY